MADDATAVSGSWTAWPTTSSNVTLIDRFSSRDSTLARAEVAVQAVIFVVTVVGNVLVIIALWRQARQRQLRRRLTLQASNSRIAQLLRSLGGSVAEWLACWTRAQKGPGSNRSRDAVG